MYNVDAFVAKYARETHGVQQHGERVLGGGRKRQPDAPFALQFANHAAAPRGDKRARSGLRESLSHVNRATFGPP